MHPWAQHSLKTCEEHGIPVEILAEVRPRLLGMDKPHFLSALNEVCKDTEERPFLHIQVFYVGSAYPKGAFHLGCPFDDLLEVGLVCDVPDHMSRS